MIPNVRCVPTFTDTLLSVDELWKLPRFDTRFSDILQLRKTGSNGDVAFSRPFVKRRGLFVWNLNIIDQTQCAAYAARAICADLYAFAAKIDAAKKSNSCVMVSKGANDTHGGRATSHIEALSPDHAAAVMHHHLHVSYERPRTLSMPPRPRQGLARAMRRLHRRQRQAPPARTRARRTSRPTLGNLCTWTSPAPTRRRTSSA